MRLKLLGMFLIASTMVFAQSVPFTWGHAWGVGARVVGMGGAYTAVSEGYWGVAYNPAGIGLSTRMEVAGGLTHLMYTNKATFMGSETTEESSYTKMDGLGILVPIPTMQGSLVLGFGFQRVRDYDGALYVTKVINTPGDSVTWEYDELEDGGLSQASFAASIEMAPGLFLGGGVHFWFGGDGYTWRFSELDQPYDLYTFSDYYETTMIETKLVGINASVGFLYRSGMFRIGGAIETPVSLSATEEWEYRATTNWDDGSFSEDSTDSGTWEYRVRSPWRFRLGTALNLGPLLVSGDVELADYSQIQYTDDEMESGEDNLLIKRNFESKMDYRIGAEFTVPSTPLKLRAGYGIAHSPFKDPVSSWDRSMLSLGAGMTFSDRLTLDAAVVWTDWERPGGEVIQQEKIEAMKVFVGFTYLLGME